MEKKTNTDKRYRIQVLINGNTLTYNNCLIFGEDETWLEFSDKFDIIYKYNKNNVVNLEELK